VPRPRKQIPTYQLHRHSGQAKVRIAGKDQYLGPFGSEESKQKYHELVRTLAERKAKEEITRKAQFAASLTIAELVKSNLLWAKVRYTTFGLESGEKRTDGFRTRYATQWLCGSGVSSEKNTSKPSWAIARSTSPRCTGRVMSGGRSRLLRRLADGAGPGSTPADGSLPRPRPFSMRSPLSADQGVATAERQSLP
jgi:hypothetical protein